MAKTNQTYQRKSDPKQRVTVTTDSDQDSERVKFYPEGGGFEYSAPRSAFFEKYEPVDVRVYRPATVTADFIGPKPSVTKIACYSDGSRWNGWGIPAFTKLQLCNLFRRKDVSVKYEFDGDVAVINLLDGEDPVRLEPLEIEDAGKKVKIYVFNVGWTFDGCHFRD